jgi:hypothetical protein
MNKMRLIPNRTQISIRNPPPDGEELFIFPGQALYDQETGFIHFIKSNEFENSALLQLLPTEVIEIHQNQAIAKVLSVLVSVFGIDFFEDDNSNKIANQVFNKAVDFSSDTLVNVISFMAPKKQMLAYHNTSNGEIFYSYPIQMPGY